MYCVHQFIFTLISLWVGLRLCTSQTLGDACPDPSCSGLENAICRFGACDCLPGFFNTGNNTCQPSINSSTINTTTAVPRSVSATHGTTYAETRSSPKESSIAKTMYATSSTTGKEDCNECNIEMIAAIAAFGSAIVITLVTVICCLRSRRGNHRLQQSKQEQHENMSEMWLK